MDSSKVYCNFSFFEKRGMKRVKQWKDYLILDMENLHITEDKLRRYNVDYYYCGSYTTAPIFLAHKDGVISWQAKTPLGTWLEFDIRSLINDNWTKWYCMGSWSLNSSPFKRRSIRNQFDHFGDVKIDTLVLNDVASAFQVRVTLFTIDLKISPRLYSFGISLSNGTDVGGSRSGPDGANSLVVPKRSQMPFLGGQVMCSPACVSMVLGYWAAVTDNETLDKSVTQVARFVWDSEYKSFGNWSFNIAYIASLGLQAKVVRLCNLNDIEQWIKSKVPVIVSVAYKSGQLKGAPLNETKGHLLVVRGFDELGNVLVNDPAALTDEDVSLTYDRIQFEQVWLNGSNGTAYLIYDPNWPIPKSNGRW
ncbi:C39 family peptidase [Paenactinomyces guangxiensis]|uniref:C39 family peptidase n=1 Tax=Paenactinomyces guangxiensis TaxID=1490290 RepID=A0A7W2A7T4_9BACL|nr:C39 family peptidase [Paenactinomyces guangxiensis]MBA4493459.1 C39 family peptidase [Paenactinomyces guangxiensis]MBH8590550.1 C39 family peptidase [Paenactinomyces guangxiensis]